MDEYTKKLIENQNKIVAKLKAIDLQIMAMSEILNELSSSRKNIVNRVGGIETILSEMGVDKKAVELHQSFDDEELRKVSKQEKLI